MLLVGAHEYGYEKLLEEGSIFGVWGSAILKSMVLYNSIYSPGLLQMRAK